MIIPHGVKTKILCLRKERQATTLKSKRTKKTSAISRRQFLKSTAAAASTVLLAPTIVPSSVFGAGAPSNRITIGMIGMGRQAYHSNLKSFLSASDTQVVAACDVDEWRLENAKKAVEKQYAKEQASGNFNGCSIY